MGHNLYEPREVVNFLRDRGIADEISDSDLVELLRMAKYTKIRSLGKSVTHSRDAIIKDRYRELMRTGKHFLDCFDQVAEEFGLSPEAIRSIIYECNIRDKRNGAK